MSQVHISEAIQLGNKVIDEIKRKIDALEDEHEKVRLRGELEKESALFHSEAARYMFATSDNLFREIRQKVISVQMDENLARSLCDEFKKIESALSGKIPPGFIPEWNDIQNELQKISALTLQNKIKSLTALLGRTRVFASQAAHAANISLAGLVEEKYTIPKIFYTESKGNEKNKKLASLLADIADFGARVAFFDESEARKLRPLMDEAASEKRSDEFRLTAIRQEVKMRYGKLKEQKVLTEVFKEELRDMLPLMKRARGAAAEALTVRMEELLTASEVPREGFMPLYEEVKILLFEQLENITDEAVAEKVGSVLSEMGYSLVGGDGESLSAREVKFMESPYEGYQVKVKVDKGGTLTTRLVRVADSEDEANSTSEYQRQKDIEIGKKWCKDLDAFHEKMRSEGIDFKTKFRKEPEEQPLDVVVAAKGTRGRKKRTQEVRAKERFIK